MLLRRRSRLVCLLGLVLTLTLGPVLLPMSISEASTFQEPCLPPSCVMVDPGGSGPMTQEEPETTTTEPSGSTTSLPEETTTTSEPSTTTTTEATTTTTTEDPSPPPPEAGEPGETETQTAALLLLCVGVWMLVGLVMWRDRR